ncbi:Protein RISC-INTERACTING CLEARING 3'-5' EXORIBONUCLEASE 2 [Linum perenne]
MSEDRLNGVVVSLDEYNSSYSMKVETKVIEPYGDANYSINVLLMGMLEKNDMVVGFGTEWDCSQAYGEHKIAMLKFCTKLGCILVRLDPETNYVSESVRKFMAFKDAIFAGVHIKDDIEKLRHYYGVVVKNPVELSEIAANYRENKSFLALGVKDLASRTGVNLFGSPGKPGVEVIMSNWRNVPLKFQQIQSATIDVYLAYRVGRKLIDNRVV